MAQSMEEFLRRMMTELGRFVESVIGKAKKAKVQVGTRGGVQPVLSLEGQLPSSRIRDLIDSATQKTMSGSIPDLVGSIALEIGEGPVLYGSRLMACRADKVVGAEIGGGSVGRQGDVSRGFAVRAAISKLPFESERFGYIIARLATVFQGDMVHAVREIGRVMQKGGQGVIVDYHPFGLYATRGPDKLRPLESSVRRFEDYYGLCRQGGIRVVDIRESFIDEGMRGMFGEEEIQVYRNLKNTPLLVFLFVYKPKGRR